MYSTCIFIFDSLGGHRLAAIRNLKAFLIEEASTKLSLDIPKDDIHIPGHYVKSPIQPNAFDCGVYLLHNAEKFLNAPDETWCKLTKKESLSDWFKHGEIVQKRKLVKQKIKLLANEMMKAEATKVDVELEDGGKGNTHPSSDDIMIIE